MLAATSVDGIEDGGADIPSPDVPDPITPDQLGRAVRQRRADLRLSQDDVREVSGLSITTIGKIERGGPDTVIQRATLRRLDLALDWTAGTAESYYHGRGGVVPDAPGGADLERLAHDLAPLIASQLRADRDPSMLSVAGLPEAVVAALEQLVREIRSALVHRSV